MSDAKSCPRCGRPFNGEGMGGLCPRCLGNMAFALDDEAEAAAEAPDSPIPSKLRYFGDYELLEEIARGGMGVVFKARQVSLNRIVAVKMLLSGQFAKKEFVERFRAEAQAAANLQHPNIVAIHEVGAHEGQQYFSMDYVEGGHLGALVRDQPLSAKRAAAYVKTIAEAIHYAHQHGVLHRDLKPSNILIDPFDQPRVTDFGLAKRLPPKSEIRTSNPEIELTQTGQILGTPGFMSPEQAGGKGAAVGPASDAYSLGAVLYFLVTGRAPFAADSLEETLRQVHEFEPVSPRLLNPSVPHDLETICLKCLEKEPRRRYSTARELAEELDRFLNDEPIHARPISPTEKVWSWCRRKPALAASLAIVFLLLLTLAIGSTVAAIRINRARREATIAEGQAKRAHAETTDKLWDSYFAQARASRFSGRSGRRFASIEAIVKAAAIRRAPELRDEAIACLALSDLRAIKHWQPEATNQITATFDATMERYAIDLPPHEVSIRRVKDDKELLRLPSSDLSVRFIHGFSHDGKLLAVRYADGVTHVWDLDRREIVLTGKSFRDAGGVDFSPDDQQIAMVNEQPEIVIHDLITRTELRTLPLPAPATNVRYDPEGRRLAVIAISGEKGFVVDAASGARLATLNAKGSRSLAWHPEGRWLAAACAEPREVKIWDTLTGEMVRSFPHASEATAVAFTHAGDLLVTASYDTTLLWNFRTGEQLVTLLDGVSDLKVSVDDKHVGRTLFRSPGQKLIDLCELANGAEARTYGEGRPSPPLKATAFSADGGLLAFAGESMLGLYDTHIGRELASFAVGPVSSMQFDGATNLWISGSRGLARWPLRLDASGTLLIGPPEFIGPALNSMATAISSDRTTLAVKQGGHSLVINISTGEKIMTMPLVQSLSLSPDGRLLAGGGWGAESVRIWDGHTGQLLEELKDDWLVFSNPIFTADGQSLAITTYRNVSLWDTETWTTRWRVPLRDFSEMAVAPDGVIAVSDHLRLVHFLAPESGKVLAVLEAPQIEHLDSLTFSPDGTRLAVHNRGESNVLVVWDLIEIRQQLARLGLDWDRPPYPVRPTPATERSALSVRVLDPVSPHSSQRRQEVARLLPSRDLSATENLIDLTYHFNLALTQSWFPLDPSRENSFAELPQGLTRLAGVDFDVRGVVQLAGAAAKKRDYPQRVVGIRVGRACRSLHALQGTREGEVSGTRIGRYMIHYTDGRQREWPMVYGQDVRDFWKKPDEAESAATLVEAWTGHNVDATAHGAIIRLFKATWKNPLPDVPIESIDFESDLTNCEPFLLAITAEP